MAFSTSSPSGIAAEINVTPLIDVLLVLLIVFMVIVPLAPRGLAALLPQPSKGQPQPSPDPPLVLQVQSQSGGAIAYVLRNEHFSGPDAKKTLTAELVHDMRVRQEKVLFIRGDRRLNFSSIADVVALAHQADAERIGILTPQVPNGE